MDAVTRGDLIAVAVKGDHGKPRPALVIQSDRFAATETLTVLLVTGTLVDAPLIRLPIEPTAENGLRRPSQIMVDKAMTVRREKVGAAFGHVLPETMKAVEQSFALFVGLA